MKSKLLENIYKCVMFIRNLKENEIKQDGLKIIYESMNELNQNISFPDFIKLIEEANDKNTMIDGFKNACMKYQKKRRGEEVKESFEELKKIFKENIDNIINESFDFESLATQPFIKELFDEFTDYKYIVNDIANNKVYEAKNLDEFKENKIDYSKYEFKISLKEAEKKFFDYVYFKRWWKPKFVEGKNLEEFIISTDGLNVYIDMDISNKEIFKESKPNVHFNKNDKFIENICEGIEYIPPNTKIKNLTSMPAWIKLLNRGKLCIKESCNIEKIIEFNGGNIEGIYKITRQTENSDFWKIENFHEK